MSSRKLANWISSFMTYTDDSESPSLYREWTAYSTVAACLQRKCSFTAGHITFYPNCYVLLIGPPGSKKGTAMSFGKRLLTDTPGVMLSAQATTKESLIHELKKSKSTLIDPLSKTLVIEHSSMTIFSEEFTVFLGYSNKEFMDWMVDWWDCAGDTWTYRTKNMGEDTVRGVWVNMIGATTPEILMLTLPVAAVGGGLMSRIVCVYEERKGKTRSIFKQTLDEDLGRSLAHDLEVIVQLRGEYTESEGFRRIYDDWYDEQDKHPPFKDRRLAGYVSKRATHVVKICMIASASRSDSMTLEEEDFETALNILRRTEVKMARTFSGFGESDKSAIINKIATTIAMEKEILWSELLSLHYYDADRDTLRDIVATLKVMNYCDTISQESDALIVYREGGSLEI